MAGKSIRLFLVDGDYNGLITAELVNWTGHTLAGPRSELPNLLSRDECHQRTGIYFLISRESSDSGLSVYIGESDDIAKRLKQHSRPESSGGKDFWDYVVVITSKDGNLTKAHVKYLESRLISITKDVGRCSLINSVTPEFTSLPESDSSDMEFFIKQVQMVVPAIGFTFLKPVKKSIDSGSGDSVIYLLESPKHRLRARATEDGADFIVLKGSDSIGKWNGKNGGYGRLYRELCDRGVLEETQNGRRVFTKDYAFSSPSAAAATVYGRSTNGRQAWIVEGTGQTYHLYQSAKIAEVLPDNETSEV